jgi:hypothetical protein
MKIFGLFAMIVFLALPQLAQAKTKHRSTAKHHASSGGGSGGRSCVRPHDEMTCLACAAYFEGGSQGSFGMTEVVKVVKARMVSNDYPHSACGVVYQPGQFTFNKRQRLPGGALLNTILAAVKKGMNSRIDASTPTHYLNPKVTRQINRGRLPKWAYTCPKVMTVGHGKNQHVFFHCPGIISKSDIAAAARQKPRHEASTKSTTKVASNSNRRQLAANVPAPHPRPSAHLESAYSDDLSYGADAGQ